MYDKHAEKLSFITKAEAEAAALIARDTYGGKIGLKVYCCSKCQGWHLASNYSD